MDSSSRRWLAQAWGGLLWGLMTLFVINIALMIASVATNSFARRWLGTWLPEGWTTAFYTASWNEFQLGDVLWVTVEVVMAVVFLSLLIGVPAAYTLARRDFRGKRALMLLFLLPLMVPPITYGIPLATVLYQAHLAGTMIRADLDDDRGVFVEHEGPSETFVRAEIAASLGSMTASRAGHWTKPEALVVGAAVTALTRCQ